MWLSTNGIENVQNKKTKKQWEFYLRFRRNIYSLHVMCVFHFASAEIQWCVCSCNGDAAFNSTTIFIIVSVDEMTKCAENIVMHSAQCTLCLRFRLVIYSFHLFHSIPCFRVTGLFLILSFWTKHKSQVSHSDVGITDLSHIFAAMRNAKSDNFLIYYTEHLCRVYLCRVCVSYQLPFGWDD